MAIWFCEMAINCPKVWEELTVTDDPLVRDCTECGKQVHFIYSQEELEAAAVQEHCVAFFSQEKDDDLSPEKRERIRLTKRINSGNRRITLGLPRRPIGDKLKSFIDNM